MFDDHVQNVWRLTIVLAAPEMFYGRWDVIASMSVVNEKRLIFLLSVYATHLNYNFSDIVSLPSKVQG